MKERMLDDWNKNIPKQYKNSSELEFTLISKIHIYYKQNIRKMHTQEQTKQLQKQIIHIYRTLHQIPQIGLEEYKTTQYIADYVNKIQGVQIVQPEVETNLKTGLIALIKASKNRDENKKAYLFRCDIDSLNFKEESGLEYSSLNGLHHACGHDAHTSMLLLAVKRIAARRLELQRDIYFCFQPGEEGHGGAQKIIQKFPHLFEHIEKCFAMHIGNFKLKGNFLIPKQYATANSNIFYIDVIGKSAHCMMPYAAIDANYIGCQIVNEIYSLKTRLINPDTGMSIIVTRIEGGSEKVASISGHMKIAGSIRSYSNEDHQKVLQYIEKYAKTICELHGARSKFTINKNFYRAIKNDPFANEIVKQAVKDLFDNVEYCKPSFAGQDFCAFSQRAPSCYFILGVGLPDSLDQNTHESKFPVHSPKFKLDETSLTKGPQVWQRITFFDNRK